LHRAIVPRYAAFFDPLLACARDWAYPENGPSVATFGIGNGYFDRQILTAEHTALPDVERRGTRILFGNLHKPFSKKTWI
jgi:hypothetical protein